MGWVGSPLPLSLLVRSSLRTKEARAWRVSEASALTLMAAAASLSPVRAEWSGGFMPDRHASDGA